MSARRQLSTIPAIASGGLRVVTEDGILRVTIDRQDRMNALDLAHMTALGDVLTDAAADPSVRVVVISGAGRAFCTGADLAAAAAAGGREAPPEVVMDSAARVIRAIVDLPVPVIAQVGGDAVAARLARGPRRAIELTKRALTASTLTALDGALDREKSGQAELLRSPDFLEGVTAMLTKRPPNFGA